jgi:negative elongation factor A
MASVPATTSSTSSKDEDVAFWLHNKLGSHVDLWSSFSISSALTQDHLLSIKSILWSLDTLVKVKLLLSFIHIPKRNISEVNEQFACFLWHVTSVSLQWEALLNDIVELSRKDNVGDQWVAVISEIMKTFPDKSLFNLDLTDQECEGYTDGIQELRKTGRSLSSAHCLLPHTRFTFS